MRGENGQVQGGRKDVIRHDMDTRRIRSIRIESGRIEDHYDLSCTFPFRRIVNQTTAGTRRVGIVVIVQTMFVGIGVTMTRTT